MNITKDRTIGSIVADDYRAAAVFTTYGIDFCCRGGRSVEEVCKQKNIDPATLENEIKAALARDAATGDDPKTWSLTKLADHIESMHHGYINQRVPVLQQ